MWNHEQSIDTHATLERVWQLLADVAGWKEWNAGVQVIELHGPFADGTTFTMTLPDGTRFTSTLLEVKAHEGFIDETWIGDTRVQVDHRLLRLPSGGTRISYRSHVAGPEADVLGPQVTADFGGVLKALQRLAEQVPAPDQHLASSP
jgi:hypothetical protein